MDMDSTSQPPSTPASVTSRIAGSDESKFIGDLIKFAKKLPVDWTPQSFGKSVVALLDASRQQPEETSSIVDAYPRLEEFLTNEYSRRYCQRGKDLMVAASEEYNKAEEKFTPLANALFALNAIRHGALTTHLRHEIAIDSVKKVTAEEYVPHIHQDIQKDYVDAYLRRIDSKNDRAEIREDEFYWPDYLREGTVHRYVFRTNTKHKGTIPLSEIKEKLSEKGFLKEFSNSPEFKRVQFVGERGDGAKLIAATPQFTAAQAAALSDYDEAAKANPEIGIAQITAFLRQDSMDVRLLASEVQKRENEPTAQGTPETWFNEAWARQKK